MFYLPYLYDSSFHLHYGRIIGKKAKLHPELLKYRKSDSELFVRSL